MPQMMLNSMALASFFNVMVETLSLNLEEWKWPGFKGNRAQKHDAQATQTTTLPHTEPL
jgi:hypothetical protein